MTQESCGAMVRVFNCKYVYDHSIFWYNWLIMLLEGLSGIAEYSLKLAYNSPVKDSFRIHRDYREPHYICWYIRRGSLRVISEKRRLNAGPGDWVFVDPMLPRSHYFAPGSEIISLHFNLRWRELDFLLPLLPPWKVTGGQPQTEMLRLAEALCAFKTQYEELDLNIPSSLTCQGRGLFLMWLAQWHRQRETRAPVAPAAIDQRVFRIMAYLSSRIGVAPMDFDGLKREVGLSRAQINRVFHNATGLTVREWCLTHCYDEAREMLRLEEFSVKEIASRLGFTDISHFTKWFRKRSGWPPAKWRILEQG